MRTKYFFIALLAFCLVLSAEAKKKGKKSLKKKHGITTSTATSKSHQGNKKGAVEKQHPLKALNWVSNSRQVFKDSAGDLVISHHAVGAAKKDSINKKRIGVQKMKKILKRSLKSVIKKSGKKKKINNRLVYQKGNIKMYQDQDGNFVMSHHHIQGHRKSNTPKDVGKKQSKK